MLSSAKLFIHILDLTTIMDAINSEINQAFENVLNSITHEASDERIKTITQICSFFLGSAEVKERLTKDAMYIEKMCFE